MVLSVWSQTQILIPLLSGTTTPFNTVLVRSVLARSLLARAVLELRLKLPKNCQKNPKLLLNNTLIGTTTSFERSVLAQTSGGVEGPSKTPPLVCANTDHKLCDCSSNRLDIFTKSYQSAF